MGLFWSPRRTCAGAKKIGEFRYKGWVRAMSEPCKCFLSIVYDLETHSDHLRASISSLGGLPDDTSGYTGGTHVPIIPTAGLLEGHTRTQMVSHSPCGQHRHRATCDHYHLEGTDVKLRRVSHWTGVEVACMSSMKRGRPRHAHIAGGRGASGDGASRWP